MNKTIAIDGACRRNGQPDCISSGACFVVTSHEETIQTAALSTVEENSTSQRGELQGLLLALDHLNSAGICDAVILTDSEYIFNTMTKDWISRWMANNWVTADGSDVKNKDIWENIYAANQYASATFFHIKGHLLSVGAKQSEKLFLNDTSGFMLYDYVLRNKLIKEDRLQHARELSISNNGFDLEDAVWQEFAAMNTVADTVANLRLTAYETAKWAQMLQ